MKRRKECFGKHKIKGVLAAISASFEREAKKITPVGYGTDIFPMEVTFKDYFLSTRTRFECLTAELKTAEEVRALWNEMRLSGKYSHHKSPKSDSEYLEDVNTGDIYRYSDHWGDVASCIWENPHRSERHEIAKSNISQFTRIDTWIMENEGTVAEYNRLVKVTLQHLDFLSRPNKAFFLNKPAKGIVREALKDLSKSIQDALYLNRWDIEEKFAELAALETALDEII